MYGTTAYELITKNGTVVGAKAKQRNGTEVEVLAASTIMAVGGFGSNIPMVIEYDNYWGNLDTNIGFTTLPKHRIKNSRSRLIDSPVCHFHTGLYRFEYIPNAISIYINVVYWVVGCITIRRQMVILL